MPITNEKVAALSSEPAPAAPAETGAPAGEAGDALPDAVLQIPAMSALLQGAPPALYAPADAKYPELSALNEHAKELTNAGIAAMTTKDGSKIVLFNALYVKPEEIKAADEAGTLDQIAVPYEQVKAEFEGAAVKPDGAASAPEASAAPSAPPGPSGSPPSAAAEKKMANARLKNVTPGTPTSGPTPGQGRIQSGIAKSAI